MLEPWRSPFADPLAAPPQPAWSTRAPGQALRPLPDLIMSRPGGDSTSNRRSRIGKHRVSAASPRHRVLAHLDAAARTQIRGRTTGRFGPFRLARLPGMPRGIAPMSANLLLRLVAFLTIMVFVFGCAGRRGRRVELAVWLIVLFLVGSSLIIRRHRVAKADDRYSHADRIQCMTCANSVRGSLTAREAASAVSRTGSSTPSRPAVVSGRLRTRTPLPHPRISGRVSWPDDRPPRLAPVTMGGRSPLTPPSNARNL